MLLSCSFLLATLAFGLAPLETGPRPIDRDGLRRYAVVFSAEAPAFAHDLEQLRTWVKQDLSAVDPYDILDIWSVGSFAGFPAWLSNEGLSELRQHSYIQKIAEDQTIQLHPMEMETINLTVETDPPFTSRADWGQVRAQQPALNLAAIPSGEYYVNISGLMYYPSGSAPTYNPNVDGSWSWDPQVGPTFSLPNNGSRAQIWIADTGINVDHQEFTPSSRIAFVGSCMSGSCVAVNGSTDDNGHGSHVMGSAGGRYRGMAPGAALASLKILDSSGFGAWSVVISAINYVANNKASGKFNILSMSLSGGAYDVMDQACNAAVAQGVTVVVAAGNDGGNACDYSPGRASQNVNYPVITVGASKASDYKAPFSNDDNCVTIFAPGQFIHSAWKGTPTTYNTISGTSMSTPLVAGSIAILTTKSPNYNLATIRQLLYRNAEWNVIHNVTSATNRLVYAQGVSPNTTLDFIEE